MKRISFLLLLNLLCFSALQAQDLYDVDSLRSIYIAFNNPDWHDIMVENWNLENGERELATLVMNGIAYDSVAIRYKGNATFFWATETSNPKIPLNIDMNDYIDEQTLMGFKKVKLANSFFDPTALRDVLGFQIYGDYMPSPEANWMKVYIEDEYIGLFPNTEAINRQFLERHFDFDQGALFKCDPSSQFGSTTAWESSDLAWYGADESEYYGRYNMKSEEGWADLVNLIDILNNSPEDLETVLNIDRAIWHLAVSTVVANYDTYNGFYMHNYYLYQHENGLFQMLPWDVSEVFGGALLGVGAVPDDEFYEWDILNEDDPLGENRPLVDFVVNHPTYRKQYMAHIRTVMEQVLVEDELMTRCEEMQASVADAQADDSNAFFQLGNLYFTSSLTSDVNSWGLNVAGLMLAAEGRKAYLENHAEVSLLAPVITQVERNIAFPQPGDEVVVSAHIENGSTVDLMVSTNGYSSHFETLEMFDDGLHGDGEAADGTYGAFVPYTLLDDDVRYYIRAQNDDAMMLHPQRAEYEFHRYVVGNTTSVRPLVMNTEDFSIYPNPFTEQITIQQNGSGIQEWVDIQIFNATGTLLKQERALLGTEAHVIQLPALSRGMYFVKIGEHTTQKVMKL